MNLSKTLLFGLLSLSLAPVFGQPILVGYVGYNSDTYGVYAQVTNFTRFSLNFPGGAPSQLIAALDKAMGKTLNVIIASEDSDVQLPSFKLKNVCLPELFQTLRAVTTKSEIVELLDEKGLPSTESAILACEFYTFDQNANDSSLWYFHVDKPRTTQAKPRGKVCRFYQLTHYLDLGYSVDDITTAAQTAWKMQGHESLQMSYHKETSLLIVVGDPARIGVVDSVLQQIYPWPKNPPTGRPAATPKSTP
jgi:hypothetical protein